jgi:uncharacterized membrane protein YqjE
MMKSQQMSQRTADQLRLVGDLFGRLIKQEVEHGRTELREKARRDMPALLMLGSAGLLAAGAAGSFTVVVVRILDQFLPRPVAAAVGSAGMAGGSAVLVIRGLQRLRDVDPLPHDTIESLRADVDALTARPT